MPARICTLHTRFRLLHHVPLSNLMFPCDCWFILICFQLNNVFSILDHNSQCDVPPITTELIDFLRKNGLNVEGIFRRSGSVATIKALQAKVDLGK